MPFFESSSDDLSGYTGGFQRANQPNAGYDIEDDGGNRVLRAWVTSPGDPVRAYPDIFFSPRSGNFYTKFRVRVSELNPKIRLLASTSETKPWLSPVSLFDEGDPVYHASVMLKFERHPNGLRIVTITRDAKNTSYLARAEPGAPLFENGAEIAVYVDVQAGVVKTYQNGQLISTGRYYGKPQLAGAHWLWYSAGDVIGEMTNDDIELGSW